MTPPLPFNARLIGLQWPTEHGGIGVTARTDEAGQAIIGLYPLNPAGEASGQATEFAHHRLMIRVIAGYDENCKAIIIYADIEITALGVGLRVVVPPHLMSRGYDRYLFAAWGSRSPRLHDAPANANWPLAPLLRKTDI